MKLPYKKNAIVRREKIVDYLLSETHPQGKSKAKFFRKIGFNETNIGEFEKTLLNITKLNEVDFVNNEKETIVVKYTIIGLIKAPNGKGYSIKTIWAIEAGSKVPHLVTVIP